MCCRNCMPSGQYNLHMIRIHKYRPRMCLPHQSCMLLKRCIHSKKSDLYMARGLAQRDCNRSSSRSGTRTSNRNHMAVTGRHLEGNCMRLCLHNRLPNQGVLGNLQRFAVQSKRCPQGNPESSHWGHSSVPMATRTPRLNRYKNHHQA